MRNLLATALIAVALPAYAADKGGPPAAAPEPVSAYTRASCYVEASAGKSITGTTVTDPAGPITINADGLQGGAGLGCDIRRDRVLIGIFGRYDILDVKAILGEGSIKSDHLWTLAARAGVKINAGTLVYGLAGIAMTEISYPGLSVDTRGIVYGAGVEFDIGVPNFAAFAEWSHVTFGKARPEDGVSLRPESDVFRLGLKLKFDLN